MVKSFDVARVFTFHPPIGDQPRRYNDIRLAAKAFAIQVMLSCPDSRERSSALTAVQQAAMWANASIAINEDDGAD